MARRIFVDTSAWLAVMDEDDSHHSEAVELYKCLLEIQSNFITTILIVSETQILLRRRKGHEKAMAFMKNVNESPRIEITYPDARLEREAKRILRQYENQDFSLTDAISFALIRQNGLTEAFAYDRHFATAGYTIIAE
ncbi:MAG: PIN domain-containing protein [Chloroflexi bacterium]|nr:PIN domain-containing protein [Chloroflexota bacterium]